MMLLQDNLVETSCHHIQFHLFQFMQLNSLLESTCVLQKSTLPRYSGLNSVEPAEFSLKTKDKFEMEIQRDVLHRFHQENIHETVED